jgi:hypothetical protein
MTLADLTIVIIPKTSETHQRAIPRASGCGVSKRIAALQSYLLNQRS